MTEEEQASQFWRELENLESDERSRAEVCDQQLIFIKNRIKFLKDRCVSLELIASGLFVLCLLLEIALIWKLR